MSEPVDENEVKMFQSKLDLLDALGIPCDACGEVLCDGFCPQYTLQNEDLIIAVLRQKEGNDEHGK